MAKRKRRSSSRPRSGASARPAGSGRAGGSGDGAGGTRSGRTAARSTATGGRRRSATPGPQRRQGSGRLILIFAAGILVIGGYYGWQWHQARRPAPPPTFLSPAPSLAERPLPGLQAGPAPWGTSISDLRARLETIGLPVITDQGVVLHIHEHLDVFVNDKRITVPANIGINPAGGYLSPLHTHDDSGLVHVESPTNRVYTLGQFFDVWGVRFTKNCLGGYCDRGDRQVRAYVGGKLIRGDPRLLELALHQEIVVTYGTPQELPRPIPSSHSFPLGT